MIFSKISPNDSANFALIWSHPGALWFFSSDKVFLSASIVFARAKMGLNIGKKLSLLLSLGVVSLSCGPLSNLVKYSF